MKTFLAFAVGVFSVACSGPSREADNNHTNKGRSAMSPTSYSKKVTIGELKAQGYSEVQRVPILSPPSNVNGVIAEGTLGTEALVFAMRPNNQNGATSIRYRCDVPENMRFDREWSEESMAKWTCELIDG